MLCRTQAENFLLKLKHVDGQNGQTLFIETSVYRNGQRKEEQSTQVIVLSLKIQLTSKILHLKIRSILFVKVLKLKVQTLPLTNTLVSLVCPINYIVAA